MQGNQQHMCSVIEHLAAKRARNFVNKFAPQSLITNSQGQFMRIEDVIAMMVAYDRENILAEGDLDDRTKMALSALFKFAHQVTSMREQQKLYFKSRTEQSLVKSKQLESIVDRVAEMILADSKQPEQSSLFNARHYEHEYPTCLVCGDKHNPTLNCAQLP